MKIHRIWLLLNKAFDPIVPMLHSCAMCIQNEPNAKNIDSFKWLWYVMCSARPRQLSNYRRPNQAYAQNNAHIHNGVKSYIEVNSNFWKREVLAPSMLSKGEVYPTLHSPLVKIWKKWIFIRIILILFCVQWMYNQINNLL